MECKTVLKDEAIKMMLAKFVKDQGVPGDIVIDSYVMTHSLKEIKISYHVGGIGDVVFTKAQDDGTEAAPGLPA